MTFKSLIGYTKCTAVNTNLKKGDSKKRGWATEIEGTSLNIHFSDMWKITMHFLCCKGGTHF